MPHFNSDDASLAAIQSGPSRRRKVASKSSMSKMEKWLIQEHHLPCPTEQAPARPRPLSAAGVGAHSQQMDFEAIFREIRLNKVVSAVQERLATMTEKEFEEERFARESEMNRRKALFLKNFQTHAPPDFLNGNLSFEVF